ncbi:MAG: Uma2 family endonuclease [Catalinimonas sp.]
MESLTVIIPDSASWTDDQLFDFCAANHDLHVERDADGTIHLMPLTGGFTGRRNFKLIPPIESWNTRGEREAGVGFDSSTGFVLPNGAMRSPDVAWLGTDRWEALTPEQQRKFVPLCPDFVLELRSDTDRLIDVQAKMDEWMANGCRLGWLVDPETRRTWVYRPGAEPEVVPFDAALDGGEVMPGLRVCLADVLG